MERIRIEDKIVNILQTKYGKERIGEGMEFMYSNQGWDMDSLEFSQFIVDVEDCFDIEIDFDKEFYTMDELVEIIIGKGGR